MDPLLHITVLAYLQIMMTQTSSEIRFPKAFNIYFLSKLISLQTADQLQLPPGSQRPDRGQGEAPVPRAQCLAPLCVGVAPGLENLQN